jgi:hypothetical protein
MGRSEQVRIEELEKLVSSLRHDLRGAITPALLVADRLRLNCDPSIQRAGTRITEMIERILSTLNATYHAVPPRGEAGPSIGAGSRPNTVGPHQ